jgi:hypothetical protein
MGGVYIGRAWQVNSPVQSSAVRSSYGMRVLLGGDGWSDCLPRYPTQRHGLARGREIEVYIPRRLFAFR